MLALRTALGGDSVPVPMPAPAAPAPSARGSVPPAAPASRSLPRAPAPSRARGQDFGPGERLRRDLVLLDELPAAEGGGKRARVVTQLPLDRYLERREITADQHAAGDRLRADFTRAGLQPRVTMHYAPRLPRSAYEARDDRLDARRRLYAALDAVGRLGEGVLWHVCCVGESAGDWAHRHGRAPRDGIALLRAALDELCAHYAGPPPRPAKPAAAG